MDILKVIVVILAVFLHHGNGRAITLANNDNNERLFDLAEEELNTVLNETNGNPTDREENSADVLKISEPVSLSHESLQYQFSSDNMIQPKEASPALRHKRSHLGPCDSGKYHTVKLASGKLKKFPICKTVSFMGCASSVSSNNKRPCVASLTMVLVQSDDGTNQLETFAASCSCA